MQINVLKVPTVSISDATKQSCLVVLILQVQQRRILNLVKPQTRHSQLEVTGPATTSDFQRFPPNNGL